MMTTTFDLTKQACLVYVKIKQPTFKTTSRALGAEVEDHHAAAEKTVAAVVQMVPAAYTKPLAKIAQRLRRAVEDASAPWAINSVRIMQWAHVDLLKQTVAPILLQWDDAVANFVKHYAAIRAEAVAQLNGLNRYVASRWPTEDEVKSLFNAKVGFAPLGDVAGDFRLNLQADAAAALRLDLQAELQANLQAAMEDNKARALEVLGRLRDAVSKYRVYVDPADPTRVKTEGAFWASTVTNVRDVATLLRSLNFLGDRDFDQICSEMAALGSVDAEHIKLSDDIKTDVIDEADRLMGLLMQ